MSKLVALLLLPLSACCISPQREISMYHKVRVPPEYCDGRGVVWVDSTVERYISMYERAWWSCMEDRAIDIHYQHTREDLIANGWPAAVDAYRKGYLDADERIRFLIARFGPETVQKHLLEVTGLDTVQPDQRQRARYKD